MSNFVHVSGGKFLRSIRRSKDLTQQNVADLVNMKRSNYARCELGSEMTLSAFVRLVYALGFTLTDFDNYHRELMKEQEKIEYKKKQDEILRKILTDTDEIMGKYENVKTNYVDDDY